MCELTTTTITTKSQTATKFYPFHVQFTWRIWQQVTVFLLLNFNYLLSFCSFSYPLVSWKVSLIFLKILFVFRFEIHTLNLHLTPQSFLLLNLFYYSYCVYSWHMTGMYCGLISNAWLKQGSSCMTFLKSKCFSTEKAKMP